ncbi:MAG: hypothetical protein WC732_08660 [Candidatus Omnitrophota bacterium]
MTESEIFRSKRLTAEILTKDPTVVDALRAGRWFEVALLCPKAAAMGALLTGSAAADISPRLKLYFAATCWSLTAELRTAVDVKVAIKYAAMMLGLVNEWIYGAEPPPLSSPAPPVPPDDPEDWAQDDELNDDDHALLVWFDTHRIIDLDLRNVTAGCLPCGTERVVNALLGCKMSEVCALLGAKQKPLYHNRAHAVISAFIARLMWPSLDDNDVTPMHKRAKIRMLVEMIDRAVRSVVVAAAKPPVKRTHSEMSGFSSDAAACGTPGKRVRRPRVPGM